MKLTNPILLFGLFLLWSSSSLMAQDGDEFVRFAPLDDPKDYKEYQSIFWPADPENESQSIQHRIEPTSPVLGHRLVDYIKSHSGHPAQILKDIRSSYPNLKQELSISTMAYLNVLTPGLKRYNQEVVASTHPQSGQEWTELEPAAIPLEVLLPLQPDYVRLVNEAYDYHDSLGYEQAVDSTMKLASAYGNEKATSGRVANWLQPNSVYTKYLPGKMARLVQLNAVISSAEAAYPRTQHSINGYSQYVYDYMLRHNDLEGMLATAYNAEREWLDSAEIGEYDLPFISHIERSMLAEGYSHRDALITLCYSSRNMPNIDIQYARDVMSALTLEVYFWKFKDLQNEAINHHFDRIFPNHVFNDNPMLYHFATASYLSYEIMRSGFSNGTAIGMAFLSKAGYKLHKFVHEASWQEVRTGRMAYVKSILKKQSSLGGIAAGYYGGLHGVSMSKMQDRMRQLDSKELRELAHSQTTKHVTDLR